MAPVFMVLDGNKSNSLIYFAVKNKNKKGQNMTQIQQFDPESV